MTAVAEAPTGGPDPGTRPSGSRDPAEPDRRVPRWFVAGLLALAVLAGGVRAVNIFVWRPTCVEDMAAPALAGDLDVYSESPSDCYAIRNDALYGHLQARLLADGHGYADPYTWVLTSGRTIQPSAGDPPLYAAFLAGVSALGFTDGTDHRVASALFGVLGVVLVGLVGRRVAGPRAGLVAAGLAALYPMLWINDGMLLNDGMAATFAAAVMWVALRWWDRPTWGRALVVGAVIGLAGLARAEALMLLGLLVLPLALGLVRRHLPGRGGRTVAAQVLALWAVAALVVAPWIVYNHDRFAVPVYLTSGTGAVFSAATCESGFYGDFLGYQPASCFDEYLRDGYAEEWPDPDVYDEAERDEISREAAMRYLSDHLDRYPVVIAARVGRMWDVYRPFQNADFNTFIEGRDRWASDAGLWMYAVLAPLGLVGAVVLGRRRVPLSPFLAPGPR